MRNSDNVFNKIKRGIDNLEKVNDEIDRAKREIIRGFNNATDIYRLAELTSYNLENFLRFTPRRISPIGSTVRKSLSFRELVKLYNVHFPKLDKKNRMKFLKFEKDFHKVGCIICGYTNSSPNARHCQKCGNPLLIYKLTGNFDEICEGFKLILKDETCDISYYLDIASIYYNKGLYKKAAKYYRKFAERSPNEEMVWIYLGLCYLKLSKYERAIKSFSNTKKSNLFYLSLLGLSYTYNNQIEKGKKICNKIKMEDPKDKLILLNLCESYIKMGEYEYAMDFIYKAIDLDYDFEVSWNLLGVVYMCNGDYLDAYDSFLKSLNRNIKYSSAWKNLGLFFEIIEDFRNAVDAFMRSITAEPHDFESWYYFSRILFKQKQYLKAYEAIKISLKLNPNIHYSLDLNELILKSHKKLEQDYKKWFSLAKKYNKSNNFKKALDCASVCLSINPEFQKADDFRKKIEISIGIN